MNRKYESEFGLNAICNVLAIARQTEMNNSALASFFSDENPCHLYIIGRRPRIGLNPDYFYCDDNYLSAEFIIQYGSAFERRRFVTRNLTGKCLKKIIAPYPHTNYEFHDINGERVSWGYAGAFMQDLNSKGLYDKYLDLEVLYVGQSFGTNGELQSPNRLMTHSTLQQIYADAMVRFPDQEIAILLMSFSDMQLIWSINPNVDVQATAEEEKKHAERILETRISERQKINFVEAALIRYFQPAYNIAFRESFPNPNHQSYSECYELDLNLISVAINTEEINCRLYSPLVKAQWEHVAMYPLHDANDRKSLLDL